jgi:phenylalanyl-tRNA synthetase beta chain
MFDIVEDIAIGHGYPGFEPEIPNISTPGEELRIERFKRSISEIAVGLGFVEVFTFNATSDKVQNEMMGLKGKIVPFSNSKSSEQSGLRRAMIPSMLEVLQANANNEYPQRVFDIGTLFSEGKTETGILEEECLCVALAGEDFTNARQALEYMLKGFGLAASFRQIEGAEFIPGRAGEITVNGKPVGRIGEIHPQVILNFKLGVPVAAFELNISKLIDLIK